MSLAYFLANSLLLRESSSLVLIQPLRASFAKKFLYEKHSISAQINVTECFIQGSELGEQLLSFILHSDTRKLPISQRREMTEYLASMTYQKNGKRYVSNPAYIYIMEKKVIPHSP
jgi:hypothetical protein